MVRVAALLFGAVLAVGAAAPAQSATGPAYLLIPYAEPGDANAAEQGVTPALAAELQRHGTVVQTAAAQVHLDAVTGAAAACKESGAATILIPEGGMQPIPRHLTAAAAQVRLDAIDCTGRVVASVTGSAEVHEALSGASHFIQDTWNAAIAHAVADLAAQTPAVGAALATSVPAAPAPASGTAVASSYAFVPVEQPGILDPGPPTYTPVIATALVAHGMTVTSGAAVDHLTVPATAAAMCATANAGGIIVPTVTAYGTASLFGPVHLRASVRLDVFSCGGMLVRRASGTATGNLKGNAAMQSMDDIVAQAADIAAAGLRP